MFLKGGLSLSNRNRELACNTVIFAVGTIGSKLIIFLLVPLYSSYMSTAEFGEADLLISTMSLIYPVFSLGIDQSILRFGLTNPKRENVLNVSTWISVIGGMILSTCVLVLVRLGILDRNYLFSIGIYFQMALASIAYNYAKVMEKNRIYSLASILSAVVLCVSNIIFLAILKINVRGYLISNILSGFFTVFFIFITCGLLSQLRKSEYDGALGREMVHYSLPLIPNSLSWWIIQMSDRYMISYFISSSLNGLYTMAYKLPSVFNLIVSIFMQAFNITVIKEVDKGTDVKYIEEIYRLYVGISFISGSALILFTRLLSRIVLRNDFYEAWVYVPLLILAYVIGNLQAFYGVLFSGYKASKKALYTTLMGAVGNIILNLIFIPCYGAFGAATATVAGYLIIYFARVKRIKEYIVFSNDIPRIIFSIIVVSAETYLYLQNTGITTMLSIAALLILAILYRKELLLIFQKVKGVFTRNGK